MLDEDRRFWTCLIDGVLWLMYKGHRLCPMNATVAELTEALKSLGE